jgi:hypothetical protein
LELCPFPGFFSRNLGKSLIANGSQNLLCQTLLWFRTHLDAKQLVRTFPRILGQPGHGWHILQNAIGERLIGSIQLRVWITPRSSVHDMGEATIPRYDRTTCARMAGEPTLSASEVSLTQALLPLED